MVGSAGEMAAILIDDANGTTLFDERRRNDMTGGKRGN
jgi:hypothetical protein